MKTIKTLFLAIAILASYSINAQVAVTTDGSSPDGSAMLEVKSTTKGFLPPRMTSAERDAISSPALGLTIFNTDDVCLNVFVGYGWRNLCAILAEGDVMNPTTGKIWMDRNLGATQVATSSTDTAAYGDLYQWGRGTDGHQIRTSGTTSTLSSSDDPGHGDFITSGSSPYDWRNPQNDNLWQGVSGTNNPCPSGYRLPTEAEWEAERQSWSSNNAAGAFASPLKLPVAGRRSYDFGSIAFVGSWGEYWSSTADGSDSRHLHLYSSYTYMGSYNRAYGCSVRCIKD